jgi:hypothetical protein
VPDIMTKGSLIVSFVLRVDKTYTSAMTEMVFIAIEANSSSIMRKESPGESDKVKLLPPAKETFSNASALT